jgi:hypothetical protein
MAARAGKVMVWVPALTEIEKVAVVEPPPLVAVIMYVTEDAAAVGVPEISPVVVLKLIPLLGVTAIFGEIE